VYLAIVLPWSVATFLYVVVWLLCFRVAFMFFTWEQEYAYCHSRHSFRVWRLGLPVLLIAGWAIALAGGYQNDCLTATIHSGALSTLYTAIFGWCGFRREKREYLS
jgi:hypothetical protein